MLRSATLFLLTAALATAQPSLDGFALSKKQGELREGPLVFELAEASDTLLFTVTASAASSEVDLIAISMTVQNHFGTATTRTVPNIRASEATVDYSLPRFLETGTYWLNVTVQDAEGNVLRWAPSELADLGLPNHFQVRVRDDFYPPELTDLDLPNIEDAFAPQGAVHLTFHDPSGTLAYEVIAESPSGKRQTIAAFQSGVGAGPSHTFTNAFSLATGTQAAEPAEEGQWRIVEVRATDSNGTTGTLYAQDLVSLGLQSRFWVGPVPPEPTPEPGCGWPNPVQSGGTVSVPASAVVYDAQGRRVGRADVYGALGTADFAPGVYVARTGEKGATPCRFTVVPR